MWLLVLLQVVERADRANSESAQNQVALRETLVEHVHYRDPEGVAILYAVAG